MTTAADAAASPAEITLCGEKFRMSPLTRAAKGELVRHLQMKIMQMVRASFTPDMTEAEKDREREIAMRHTQRVSMTSRDMIEYLTTEEGVTHLLWICMRDNHPDLTLDQLENLVERAVQEGQDPEAMDRAMDAWDLMHNPDSGNRDVKKNSRSKKKKKSRKKKSR